MTYRLVIFDFDGTIADTSEGILDSHKHVLKVMNHVVPGDEDLKKLIGGNLLNIYTDKFGFEPSDARNAVNIYRNRYSTVGLHKAVLYHGVTELLKHLKEKNITIAVATLKAEKFAVTMLEEMHVREYFDYICGMDDMDSLTKVELVQKCMKLSQCPKEQTVLVGDSENDEIGAKNAGVDFIGVTYGFGFNCAEGYHFKMGKSIDDLERLLLQE